MLKKTLCVLGAAALVALTPARGSAQTPPDQRTILTFSQPVTIPGHTLPAGTYEFQVADTGDRHVIQVFEKGGTKILATVFAIPALRADRPAKADVRFLETPANMPQAVQSWWYIGETTGHELIYPRAQAKLLAKTNPTGVLAGEGRTGEITRVMPSGEETKVDESKSKPMTTSTTPMTTSTPVLNDSKPAMNDTKPATMDNKPAMNDSKPVVSDSKPYDTNPPKTDNSLPRTASPLPWVLFAGVAFLGAAAVSVASRSNRRRQV